MNNMADETNDKRIGNKFWELRSKHGRDKIFTEPETLLNQAKEYFKWCDENPLYKNEMIRGGDLAGEIIPIPTMRPYTIYGLTMFLGVNKGYFDDFERGLRGKSDEISKGFSVVITYIREVIYHQKYDGAVIGVFNASLIAKDLGLVEKTEVKTEVSGEVTNHNIDYSKLSDETLRDILRNIQKND